jgi:hypothetical protein
LTCDRRICFANKVLVLLHEFFSDGFFIIALAWILVTGFAFFAFFYFRGLRVCNAKIGNAFQ